ncbi:dephospho-CoA kinase, partial [Ketobacter sp.]
RKWLERLTHPLIAQEILSQIQSSTSPYTILVSPLLLEGNQHQMVDRILVIDVPQDIQINRTIRRDTTTEAGVKAIIAAQMQRQQRCDKADDIIVNDKDLASLHEAIDRLHTTYLDMANARHKQL